MTVRSRDRPSLQYGTGRQIENEREDRDDRGADRRASSSTSRTVVDAANDRADQRGDAERREGRGFDGRRDVVADRLGASDVDRRRAAMTGFSTPFDQRPRQRLADQDRFAWATHVGLVARPSALRPGQVTRVPRGDGSGAGCYGRDMIVVGLTGGHRLGKVHGVAGARRARRGHHRRRCRRPASCRSPARRCSTRSSSDSARASSATTAQLDRAAPRRASCFRTPSC